MDSTVPSLLLTLCCLVGKAVAQGPAPAYEKQASWAETMASLRAQTVRQPRLFASQSGFGPQSFGGFGAPNAGPFGPQGFGRFQAAPAPAGPLVDLWTQLERDFPLECDWMQQDLAACGFRCSNPTQTDQYPLCWFGPRVDADLEQTLVLRVLEELGEAGETIRSEMESLIQADASPHNLAWLELYAAACRQRRELRLRSLAEKCPSFVFTKHFNMGGSHYAFTEGLSDAQSERHFIPGSALCVLELKDGAPEVRVLLDDPTGVIRDPDVAYAGDRVLFAWKKSDRLDDYHLHELDLASGNVRQLTFGLGFADYEGAYVPGGDIVFNSSRCVQSVDCFFTEVSNLYTCDRDGRFLRRLGFDQVHSNYPTLTEDGRVIYTRWEYNDRGQIYTQALFQMNPDGTSQTEYYGNNSYFPTATLHARQIPGTPKVLAVAAGHHNPQMGKLIILDPTQGRQENQGAQLVAPVRPTPAVKVDAYGQFGELWQYPYPLSETEFLVSYSPWGRAREPLLFGIYYMAVDGRRELLVSDPAVSCNQPVPLRRPVPHRRPNSTDYASDAGTFYIQDVYAGPGLNGIPRGEAKKLRVIGLDFRPTVVGGNHNRGEAGEAFVATPVSVAQGSWQAKTVLGETPIRDDGSVFFIAPARTPLYFQVVDEKGYVIQTMRSWATLQPGENASCVGCHEHKSGSPLASYPREALRQRPRKLDPFYGPPRGFSFTQEIQPILDRHCTDCHHDRSELPWLAEVSSEGRSAASGTTREAGDDVAFSLLPVTTTDWVAKRRFSDGYLALTGAVRGYDQSLEGTSRALVNWTSPQSGPPMRLPYSAGSASSDLMTLLEDGHEGVRLTREETEKLACWIDLVVPYCGDYYEANAWMPFETARYNQFLTKREKMEAIEERNLRELVADQQIRGTGPAPDEPPASAVMLTVEVASAAGDVLLQQQAAADPHSPLAVDVPRPLQAGDRIRVGGARHLAVRFDSKATESLLYMPDGQWEWTIPANASTGASDSEASDRPRLTFRPVALAELDAYRNLAANPCGLPGGWPRQSWDAGASDSPEWQIDFGRMVEIDKVVIVLRGDSSRDSEGHEATVIFGNGNRRTIGLKNTPEPQILTFEARTTSSVRVTGLLPEEQPGGYVPAEVQVWGRDPIPLAEDLSGLAPWKIRASENRPNPCHSQPVRTGPSSSLPR